MNQPGFKTGIVSLFFFISVVVLPGCNVDGEPAQLNGEFQYQARLQSFDSCDALAQYLVETAQTQQQLYTYHLNNNLGTPVVAQPVSTNVTLDSVAAGAGYSSAAIEQVTGTNNQVAGVDEADFIKTDGEYTYVVSGGYLLIFDTWPAADSSELSRVELKGYPAHLLVSGDIAWVASTVYDHQQLNKLGSFAPRVNALTQVSLFDISDRGDPQLIREVALEGHFTDARMIDNQVHMVTSAYFDIYPLLASDALPGIEKMLPQMFDTLFTSGVASATTQKSISDCASIYRPGTANGTGTVSLVSFDLVNPKADITRQTIVSNSGMVYANQQSLYLASVEDYYWIWLPVVEGASKPTPGTTIHKFSLQGTPRYSASGRIDGHLINQFAMDEYQDQLRAVTTEFAWWTDADPRNTLFVLQESTGELVTRSKLEGLGKPGERVYAVRFMQDKGFLVTFEQIDPLYTLDLTDPDNPIVAGSLEVPGFSTYLHPISKDLILAIGRGTNTSSLDLSLFDISNFYQPQLAHRISIGKGSYSAAEYNHKAFTWFADKNLLALPFTRWSGNLDGAFLDYQLFNGLQVYQVDQQDGFKLLGEVDHSNFYKNETDQLWYYPDSIRRSFFVSDTADNSFLYSLSSRGLKVNSLDDLHTDLAELPLPHDLYPVSMSQVVD